MSKNLSQILVVDVESTCWESNSLDGIGMQSEIIEIGIARLIRNEVHYIVDTTFNKSIIIEPQYSTVSQYCTNLTGHTQANLEENGISFAEAYDQLCALNSKNLTWASWGDYDRLMFERMCELHTVQYPFGSTHLNVKNLFALKHFLTRELGMMDALKHLNLGLIGTQHRGSDDAFNIARLLKVCLM